MAERKEPGNKKQAYAACCDIYNDKEKVILTLEMPGVSKDHLDIRIDNDLLIISGEKHLPEENGKYLIREIRAADYYQRYTIDDTIDRNNIDASVKNGVVTLTLAIKESVKPRKIEVVAK